MQLQLLPAQDSDFETLLALRIRALRPSLEALGRFDPQRARERFRQAFSPARTLRIELEGSCIGLITVDRSQDPWALEQLYLDPSAQGCGIGSHLLRQLLQEADQAQVTVRVDALRGSDANRFYRQHGFEQIGEGEWDIHYQRPFRLLH
ncbi:MULTISPECIES: GNAT family N-acetyltransferase [Leeia]|uniref:GNAT family N-acetyltransferase n=1 Tax=Leeia aquatica TaxID=2725557 RepID=A0A847SFL8_9NEIS|nr:GNAT family N-acetyltransferase [Leeia aquatica]NLR76226.1 GNAT family N-acetyltransferase [Leeia aquatica]